MVVIDYDVRFLPDILLSNVFGYKSISLSRNTIISDEDLLSLQQMLPPKRLDKFLHDDWVDAQEV